MVIVVKPLPGLLRMEIRKHVTVLEITIKKSTQIRQSFRKANPKTDKFLTSHFDMAIANGWNPVSLLK